MMKKPDKCCGMGSYEHQVPMPLSGRRRGIDLCIADIVAALNAANIETVASCCGHGILNGNVVLVDGRVLVIMTMEELKKLDRETLKANGSCEEAGGE
jgi:hypothetical protein